MADPNWFGAIAAVSFDDSRGTAFVISDSHALTACHVLTALTSREGKGQSELIKLTFRDGSTESCHAIAWDVEADWLLLKRLKPQARPHLPLLRLDVGQPAWRSFGFPDTKPDGLAVGGRVTAWRVAWKQVDVMQLLCDEALAGNFEVRGLSGAPCVVNDSAVVGILRTSLFDPYHAGAEVNAAGTVFACLIGDVLRGLADNGLDEPPAFRPTHLPRLCEQQRHATLDELIRREHYLPDLHTPREAIESFLARLASGNSSAQAPSAFCALVGGSGVGKTSLLASVAHRTSPDTVLLLIRAIEIASDSRSLADVVNRELSMRAADEHAPVDFDVAALWRNHPGPKAVLLDGLNELPAAIDATSWIERTVSWLEANAGTTVIASCRPEYWSRCAPLVPEGMRVALSKHPTDEEINSDRPHQLQAPAEEGPVIVLGDFDRMEAEDALRRSFGERPPITPSDVAHPLMLRIFRELRYASRTDDHPPPRKMRALEQFVKRKLDRIAMQPGGAEPRVLLAALRALAASIAFNEQAYRYEAEHPSVLPSLVKTGLLTASGDELGFVHDEALEYLASASVRLADYDDAAMRALIELPEPHRVGALKFALIAALDKGEKTANPKRILRRLLIRATWALDAAAEVLVSLPEASAFVEELGKYFDLRTYGLRTADPKRVMSLVRIDTRSKLNLLRQHRTEIEAYDWESHHWKDLDRYVLRNGPLEWLEDAIAADPAAAFVELQSWLSDSSQLSDSKATVAHLAGGLITRYAGFDFESACSVLAGNAPSGWLSILVDRNPDSSATLAARWLRSERDVEAQHGLLVSEQLTLPLPPELIASLGQRIARLTAGTVEYERLRRTLLLAEPASRRFNDELLADLADPLGRSRHARVDLSHLLRTDFDATIQILDRLHEFSDEQLYALGDFVGHVNEHCRVVALLRRIRDEGLAREWPLGRAIETQLRVTSADSVMRSGIVELACIVLCSTSDSMARSVFYGVLARLNDPPRDWPKNLLSELVDGGLNVEPASMLLAALPTISSWWSQVGPCLPLLRSRLGESQFALTLLNAGRKDDATARQLAQWSIEYPALFESGALQQFRDLLAAGIAASPAASQAWDLAEV